MKRLVEIRDHEDTIGSYCGIRPHICEENSKVYDSTRTSLKTPVVISVNNKYCVLRRQNNDSNSYCKKTNRLTNSMMRISSSEAMSIRKEILRIL